MNTAPIYLRWLLDNRRALLGWAAGLAGVCLLYLPLFPSMRDSGLIGEKLDVMPKEMIESFGMDLLTVATGWGYTHQMVFGMLGLLLLLVLGIGQGSRAIAGDEESGSLELTLAHATDRRSVLSARLLAVVTIVAAMTLGLTLVVAALSTPSELGLSASGLLGEGAALGLLVLLHAMVAFAVGALTGRRSAAMGAAAVVAVLGWFAHNMGAKVAEWVPDLSPYQWAFGGTPLRNGPDLGGLGALAAGCVLLIAVSYVAFARRDLRA